MDDMESRRKLMGLAVNVLFKSLAVPENGPMKLVVFILDVKMFEILLFI
jgi:hypothetical protein